MSRHGISAIRQYAKQENQSNAIPAPAFSSSALTGNPTIGIVASAEQVTHPTSWTEIAEGGYLTPDTFSEVASRNSGFTGTTITWGGTVTSAWCSLIIELDASVAVVVSGPFRSVASQYHVPGSVANQGR
jgi:hypothetical protein